jgi:glycosyltransferase involved in cell wall biosynthesis
VQRERAVLFQPGPFPHTISYPEARPALVMRDLGIEVHLVEVKPAETAGHRQFEGTTLWTETSRLRALIRVARLRPRLLLTNGSTWPLLTLPFAKHPWVRAVNHSRRPVLARAERLLIRRAAYVSFTSPSEAEWWSQPAAKVVELPYPVDVEFWSAPISRNDDIWRKRGLNVPRGDVLCYAAQLMVGKRQVELVQDLAPLLEERTDLSLVLAGFTAEPATEAELRRLLSAMPGGDRVHLVGRLTSEELRQLFAWSTVHIINSAAETQCMALYESLAAGTAAVISDIPVLTSAFPFLPAHRNGEELRTNVIRLLEDPQLRERLVLQAHQRVGWADVRIHDTSIDAIARQLFTVPLKGAGSCS